jgi:hypothetical protein
MSRRFGWCLEGRHTDDEGGCPGQIGGPDGLACSCDCHNEGDA